MYIPEEFAKLVNQISNFNVGDGVVTEIYM